MTLALKEFVSDFAQGIMKADSKGPRYRRYQPGIGPHSEKETIRLVFKELEHSYPEKYEDRYSLEVRYPDSSGFCDICLGNPPDWKWSIEVKMLRCLGDNGTPDGRMMKKILSPYLMDKSALTDCLKLMNSEMSGKKAMLILGYDHEGYPLRFGIWAFGTLAIEIVHFEHPEVAEFGDLLHPIHSDGAVFAWELVEKRTDTSYPDSC